MLFILLTIKTKSARGIKVQNPGEGTRWSGLRYRICQRLQKVVVVNIPEAA
jgi:hypothetical protein